MSISASEVIPLFGPCDSDWIVTLVTKQGRVVTRRVSPSRLDEETAVRVAMNASEIGLANLDSYSVRRASDRSLVANGDEFLAHLKSKKRN